MRRRTLVLAGVILSPILAATIIGSATPATIPTINIDNFAFTPSQLTVEAGTKVDWTNRDDIPHTVTDAADPRAFKSPPLDTGDGFSHVFTTPGTYRYFCSLHPHMTATILVQ
jgi:plastocyanin